MSQLLQGNPQLWSVAGDLFVKNMDWPGAQEMAKRFAKTIDPKLMQDDDKPPELQAAEQQIQAMGQELDQLQGMLQNVNKSMEAQDLQRKEFEATIKAFDAETKRISAVQASMTPEQIQDIIMGTIHGAITSGDLVGAMPNREMSDMNESMPAQMPPQEIPQEIPQEMLSQGMPPQGMPQ
jgi:TolA-binding protein